MLNDFFFEYEYYMLYIIQADLLGWIWGPILREVEVVGVRDGTIRKSDGDFL